MPIKVPIHGIPFKLFEETGTYLARTRALQALIHLDGLYWKCSLVLRVNGQDYVGQGRAIDPAGAVFRAKSAATERSLRHAGPAINPTKPLTV